MSPEAPALSAADGVASSDAGAVKEVRASPSASTTARAAVPEVLRIDSGNIGKIAAEYDVNGMPLPAVLKTIRCSWINHDYPYAHALIRDGRIVGWLQSIFADRPIGGKLQTICNLSTWYLVEESRGPGMQLIFAALRAAGNVPVTGFTPGGLSTQLFKALKFRTLDNQRHALPLQHDAGPQAIGDGDALFWALDAAAKQVYNQHRELPVQHCFIPDAGGGCYIAYQTRDRLDLRVADLLYVAGDRDLLLSGQWRPPSGSQLAACQVLLIDERFIQGNLTNLALINPINPRFYHGPAELRENIDFMYSEIALFPQNLL